MNCNLMNREEIIIGKTKKAEYRKEWLIVFLLCTFLGLFGIHRFYTGKTKTGLAMIFVTVFTFGTLGIVWVLFDWFCILTHNFDFEY